MSVIKNTKIYKKVIIAIVFLILFNVCYPIQSNANDIIERMKVGIGELFFGIEDGLMQVLNQIFVDKDYLNVSPGLYLSPETIIKGKFALMNANIFEEIKNDGSYYDVYNGNNNSIVTGKNSLRETVAGWYYALRNLSIVALLSVLVYVGIRMTISTVSQDKAKYKTMLKDWLVALCLVFTMHYMMVGILNISSIITNAIGRTGQSVTMTDDIRSKIEDDINNSWEGVKGSTSELDKQTIHDNMMDAYGNLLIYAAIIVFTVVFTVKYIMRAITIVFLILIAPITAVTYPIDKIKDGKAQAFDFWFREFFFQVIIQPFHLLIYVVLIGSATDLASSNIIYSILCYAMMIPAEKIIKQMFGINDKLGSPLGAFASGAAASQLISKATQALNSKNNKGGNSSGNGNSSTSESEGSLPPKTKSGADLSAYEDSDMSDGNNSGINQEEEQNNMLSTQDSEINRYVGTGNNTTDTDDRNDNNVSPVKNPAENSESTLSEEQRDSIDQDNVNQEIDSNQISDIRSNNIGERNDNQRLNQPSNIREQNKKQPSKARMVARAIKSQAARDVRKKYGTTKFKKVAGKMATNGLKKAAGITTRATLGAMGAVMAGGFALATGDPKKVFAAATAGAALGNSAGRRINGISKSIGNNAQRYVEASRNALTNENSARKKAKNQYMQNQKERDYVSQRLQDKNGGIEPSRKEIDEEMNQRWSLKESGVNDNSIIDSALDLKEQKINDNRTDAYDEVENKLNNDRDYRRDYDSLMKGDITDNYFNDTYGEGSVEKAREYHNLNERAEDQALCAAVIANDYSKKEFMDKKTMSSLQNNMVQEFMQKTNCSKEYATKHMNNAIVDAANIRGVKNPNIPESRLTNRRNATARNTTRANTSGTQSIDSMQNTTTTSSSRQRTRTQNSNRTNNSARNENSRNQNSNNMTGTRDDRNSSTTSTSTTSSTFTV